MLSQCSYAAWAAVSREILGESWANRERLWRRKTTGRRQRSVSLCEEVACGQMTAMEAGQFFNGLVTAERI